MIKGKWGHWGGPQSNVTSVLIRDQDTDCTEGRPRGDTGRGRCPHTRERGLWGNRPATPGSRAPACRPGTVSGCGLSLPGCGIVMSCLLRTLPGEPPGAARPRLVHTTFSQQRRCRRAYTALGQAGPPSAPASFGGSGRGACTRLRAPPSCEAAPGTGEPVCAARDRRGHSPPNDATMEDRGARNHGAGSQTLLQTKSQPERGRASRCALTQPGCLGFMREFWRAPAQAGLHVAWAAVTADPTAHLLAWPQAECETFLSNVS